VKTILSYQADYGGVNHFVRRRVEEMNFMSANIVTLVVRCRLLLEVLYLSAPTISLRNYCGWLIVSYEKLRVNVSCRIIEAL